MEKASIVKSRLCSVCRISIPLEVITRIYGPNYCSIECMDIEEEKNQDMQFVEFEMEEA